MWFFGVGRGTELIPKVATIQANPDLSGKLLQYYGILTILDQKATGLLTVNALLIAGLVTLITASDVKIFGVTPPKDVLQWQLAALGISSFLCLTVIRIAWGFLRYVRENPGSGDFGLEIRRLTNVVDDRTHCYWLAWAAAMIGFLLTAAWWSWCFAMIAFVVVAAWLLVQSLTS